MARRREGAQTRETSGADTAWYRAAEHIVAKLLGMEQAWPFSEPVTEDIAPQYFDVISHPTDLKTISERLQARAYPTLENFVADVGISPHGTTATALRFLVRLTILAHSLLPRSTACAQIATNITAPPTNSLPWPTISL